MSDRFTEKALEIVAPLGLLGDDEDDAIKAVAAAFRKAVAAERAACARHAKAFLRGYGDSRDDEQTRAANAVCKNIIAAIERRSDRPNRCDRPMAETKHLGEMPASR